MLTSEKLYEHQVPNISLNVVRYRGNKTKTYTLLRPVSQYGTWHSGDVLLRNVCNPPHPSKLLPYESLIPFAGIVRRVSLRTIYEQHQPEQTVFHCGGDFIYITSYYAHLECRWVRLYLTSPYVCMARWLCLWGLKVIVITVHISVPTSQ